MSACPQCGDRFERIGKHFAHGSCDYPELSDRQRSLVMYLILRGATTRTKASYSRLEVTSTSEQWIRDVGDRLGWVGNEPRLYESAEDTYDRCHDAHPSLDFERENFADLWAVSTIAHPAFEELADPSDVDSLTPETLRWVIESVGTWVGLLFGSLHVDLRGWDVSGDQFRPLLHDMGVPTAEYEGDGYAEDTFTERYHWHDDVVVVPHYEGLDLLKAGGLSVSDVAEPIKLR